VVGASSGIGEAIARELAANGTPVALLGRRIERINDICRDINARSGTEIASPFQADVRDWRMTGGLFASITERIPTVDLLVYAAGVMPAREPERQTPGDVDAIETNLTGAVAWINEAVMQFTKRGRGTVVGISSVAGDRGRRGNPVYNATKAALSVYLESLRARLSATGVNVVTVKPGFVRTAIIGTRAVFPPAASAQSAARDTLRAAERGARVAYVPWWWHPIVLLMRLVPAPIMERLPI